MTKNYYYYCYLAAILLCLFLSKASAMFSNWFACNRSDLMLQNQMTMVEMVRVVMMIRKMMRIEEGKGYELA